MASAWKIEILPKPGRALDEFKENFGDDAYYDVLQDILSLEDDPTPSDAAPMRGTRDLYRVYTYRAKYRIIYQVLLGRRLVLIVKFGPRRSVYSGFDRW